MTSCVIPRLMTITNELKSTAQCRFSSSTDKTFHKTRKIHIYFNVLRCVKKIRFPWEKWKVCCSSKVKSKKTKRKLYFHSSIHSMPNSEQLNQMTTSYRRIKIIYADIYEASSEVSQGDRAYNLIFFFFIIVSTSYLLIASCLWLFHSKAVLTFRLITTQRYMKKKMESN